MQLRTQDIFIGVDGGGTKTSAVVIDNQVRVLGEGRAGASNPIVVGLDSAVQAVSTAIRSALSAANLSIKQVSFAYLGIAGIEHPDGYKSALEALKASLPDLNFELGTDARVALAGATDLQPGVAIISGTGSIAFGRNAMGNEARSGGWGSAIGDEGSGYYVARRGLNAVAKAFDGRGPKTLITDLLREQAGIFTAADLQRLIYYPFANNSKIASYNRFVVEAARAGDPVAREILSDAGRELGMAVTAVIESLGMQSDSFPVAYIGGNFQAGELLLAGMRSYINKIAPQARIQPPLYSPVVGAAKLAMAHRPLRKSA
jgi:N-acetylglucosamine kinase-like BadF-type ATPase